jgi:hypothetical protein
VVFFSVFSRGTALFALSDARLLLLRSKKGACQLANAFDCLLHFAFTSAPQQYTKERNVTRAAAAAPPPTTTSSRRSATTNTNSSSSTTNNNNKN